MACSDTGAFAGGDHAAHDHAAHGHHDAREASLQDAIASESIADLADGDRPGSSGLLDCDGCPHMHVHCCASMAIPAGDYGLKLGYAASMRISEASAPLPLGQHFYPLLRPPSASV